MSSSDFQLESREFPPAAPGVPQGSNPQILTTLAEVREASLSIARSAQRLLSIYTLDLESMIYGEEPFLEAIKRLVLARSYAKVRVLLADPARAVVDGNRFLILARRLTSCIDMRVTQLQEPGSAGVFMVADDRATLYRPQPSRWDGISALNDPPVARRYLNFFDEVWQSSAQDSNLRQMRM